MVNQTIGRRALLKGAGVVALAASGAVPLREARAQHQVRYSSGTEAAKLKAPVNACDCHMHIYDSRFPVAANATLRPPDASVEDYRMLQQRTGTTRNVVVTPSTYGTDNSCTLDAMAKLGAVSRGVAVVDTSVSDDELKRLAGLGIRGIRFNLVQSGATTIDMLEPLSKRVNALGWHVQIHMLGDQIVQIADLLQRLPSPIVFDHMGRISKEVGPEHPAFRVIAGLVEKGRGWVKLSGAYMDTKIGPPSYADSTKLAQAFAKAAPDRMIWGSDWPHPTEKLENKPDDAILFDLLAAWLPDDATRRLVLVDNPAALYGFPKA
jgi:predicted TIM-barrel fold metal-dependent hydrolase